MDFQAYLGIVAIVAGLAMSGWELSRRRRPAALMSLLISLQGALLLATSVMEPGWPSRVLLILIGAVGISMGIVGARLLRRQAG